MILTLSSNTTGENAPSLASNGTQEGGAVVPDNQLGLRIKEARERSDLSQTALAKKFKLTRSAVSQWESGSTEPTPENLRGIAIETGVDYNWLATGRGNNGLTANWNRSVMIKAPKKIVTDVPRLLKAIAALIPGRGKQGVIAKKLGADRTQISSWMGGQEPLGKNLEAVLALAREMGVISDVRSEDVAEDLHEAPVRRMVKLKGYVGAGSVAHFYALADEDFEEVLAPAEATDQTIAVEIKGSSWGPRMNTWLVFYDDVRSPVTPDLIGETCVVGLADDRILIKEIQRNGRGGYRLLSNSPTEDEIDNAEIEWAAKVTSMRPR